MAKHVNSANNHACMFVPFGSVRCGPVCSYKIYVYLYVRWYRISHIQCECWRKGDSDSGTVYGALEKLLLFAFFLVLVLVPLLLLLSNVYVTCALCECMWCVLVQYIVHLNYQSYLVYHGSGSNTCTIQWLQYKLRIRVVHDVFV